MQSIQGFNEYEKAFQNATKMGHIPSKLQVSVTESTYLTLLSARSPWSALKTGLARLVSERSSRGGHSAFHREGHQTHTHTHLFMREPQQIEFVHLILIFFIINFNS